MELPQVILKKKDGKPVKRRHIQKPVRPKSRDSSTSKESRCALNDDDMYTADMPVKMTTGWPKNDPRKQKKDAKKMMADKAEKRRA